MKNKKITDEERFAVIGPMFPEDHKFAVDNECGWDEFSEFVIEGKGSEEMFELLVDEICRLRRTIKELENTHAPEAVPENG